MSKRKSRIEIHLSEDEKVMIKKSAAEARLPISDYCLQIIQNGSAISRISPEELSLVSKISAVGNNLNQAVKVIHQAGISEQRLEKVIRVSEEIQNIIDSITK